MQSAPPGWAAPASAVDLASALAEASAWMATSRGGARSGSAGNLAAAAGGAHASPLLQPEDAFDADAAPFAASQQFAPSVGGSKAVDARAAAQPGVSAVELQTALSMIGEDEARDGLGSGTGPVLRLQPRQLTVGGAPRKASDAMVNLHTVSAACVCILQPCTLAASGACCLYAAVSVQAESCRCAEQCISYLPHRWCPLTAPLLQRPPKWWTTSGDALHDLPPLQTQPLLLGLRSRRLCSRCAACDFTAKSKLHAAQSPAVVTCW